MNAVILAGDTGHDLRPLTLSTPTPMLTVANVPVIDYAVAHLRAFGIREFVYMVGHKHENIVSYAAHYKGVTSRFLIESEPLGSLGGIKGAEQILSDVFLVISGNVIENIDLSAMFNKHFNSGALITMAVTPSEDISAQLVESDAWGTVIGINEKEGKAAKAGFADCGIYIVDKQALAWVPKNTFYNFLDLFVTLIPKRKLSTFIHEGYFSAVNTQNKYFTANFDLLRGGFFDPAPHCGRERRYSQTDGQNNLIAVGAQVFGNIKNSIIGFDAIIEKNAELDTCIVLEGARVAKSHRNCILGQNFILQNLTFFSQNAEKSVVFLQN
ncbi:MAG: sugar phosphate nucleotidyltransferase [Firmicutes bacterium]|nr:sugar phosphate nucleotidyltransferase [Bacillota bacterium]